MITSYGMKLHPLPEPFILTAYYQWEFKYAKEVSKLFWESLQKHDKNYMPYLGFKTNGYGQEPHCFITFEYTGNPDTGIDFFLVKNTNNAKNTRISVVHG